MDLNVLRTSLSAFGTITLCDWNTEREVVLLICIDSFNGDLDGYNSVIDSQVKPTLPYISDFSVEETIDRLKASYQTEIGVSR